MKLITICMCAAALSCQSLEVVPLTDRETAQLVKLQGDYDLAMKTQNAAFDRLCAAKAAIKKTHRAVETGGGCGLIAWGDIRNTTSVATTGDLTGTGSTWTARSSAVTSFWEFDKAYKFLIHSK